MDDPHDELNAHWHKNPKPINPERTYWGLVAIILTIGFATSGLVTLLF